MTTPSPQTASLPVLQRASVVRIAPDGALLGEASDVDLLAETPTALVVNLPPGCALEFLNDSFMETDRPMVLGIVKASRSSNVSNGEPELFDNDLLVDVSVGLETKVLREI